MKPLPEKIPPLRQRIARSIWRVNHQPAAERDWLRLAASNLILHLHPPRIPAKALKFTYTFGLGGLSILLILILIVTGILLTFAYSPTPDTAYLSIIALQTEVWYGQFIRNIHHWSGNILLAVVFLHLLRVFFTGAFHHPREFNWVLGLGLLALVAVANFTGYLLPWDQLAYWAVTVVTGIIGQIPIIGQTLHQFVLGGTEVGAVTLRNFFALHVMLVPLGLFAFGSFHIWRVRKDKGSLPRNLDEARATGATESSKPKPVITVSTLPNLVAIELVFALFMMTLLLAWSTRVNAPLQDAALPTTPPNPAKAAWYFVGLQELLLHFHPAVAGVVIPALLTVSLIYLPYSRGDLNADYTGIWFRSRRGRLLAMLSFGLGVLVTVALVVLSEAGNLSMLLPEWEPIVSNGFLPLGILWAGVWGYGRLVRACGATRGEAQLALFVLILAAFLTLTVIGNLFRGPDWKLMLPWVVFA